MLSRLVGMFRRSVPVPEVEVLNAELHSLRARVGEVLSGE